MNGGKKTSEQHLREEWKAEREELKENQRQRGERSKRSGQLSERKRLQPLRSNTGGLMEAGIRDKWRKRRARQPGLTTDGNVKQIMVKKSSCRSHIFQKSNEILLDSHQ